MAETTLAELVLRVRGDVDSAENDLTSLDNKIDGFTRRARQKLREFGTETAKLAAGAVTATAVASVKAAADWESAFADVRKTVDGTDEQLSVLEDSLRDMASEGVLSALENSHDELAGIAAIAGQLGVKTDDISDFTRVMGAMAVATNLSSEEAATFAARFANITGMDISNVENLGDAIVTLGNNMAAQESDITNMANRLATLSTFNFDVDEILGYSAAMASLGLSAELGGSNFVKTVSQITSAVAEGGPALRTFAETAGMTADEFAELNKNDPSAAFNAFIEGLGKLDADEQLQTLQALNITSTEQQRVLLTLASGYATVEQGLSLANDAFEGNNALMDEAAAKADTTAGNFNSLKNKVNDLAVDIGEALLPAFNDIITGAGNVVDGLKEQDWETVASGLERIVQPFGDLIGDILGFDMPDLSGGLVAFVDGMENAMAAIQIVLDRAARGIDLWMLNVKLDILEFVYDLRNRIYNLTKDSMFGPIDIAPGIVVDTGDIRLDISNREFADDLTRALYGQLNSEDFDLASVLFGPEGFEKALTPEQLQGMIDFGGFADAIGWEGKRAIQDGMKRALEENDVTNIELLAPLALGLDIDQDSLKEQVATALQTAVDAGDADTIEALKPLVVALDIEFADYDATTTTGSEAYQQLVDDAMYEAREAAARDQHELQMQIMLDPDLDEASAQDEVTTVVEAVAYSAAPTVDLAIQPGAIDTSKVADAIQRALRAQGWMDPGAGQNIPVPLSDSPTGGGGGSGAALANQEYHSGGVVGFQNGADEGWAWVQAGETVRTKAQEASIQQQLAGQAAAMQTVQILVNSYGQSFRDVGEMVRRDWDTRGYMN
ncbi:phage tail tape measure protein [Phototrophicus methaneseepsis]|uniref:Phage tail tape measure protein n=1 Tax=Phototrophicus methaneseepsis TaxID=2710758 RepID=A0A7S8E854_9CHLR|nr:phage tail tape measure protein [Phototrophicus methaneseepsis]QPC82117.1 phage tail tape measure protein [Phototrophicus methaneseepsis]